MTPVISFRDILTMYLLIVCGSGSLEAKDDNPSLLRKEALATMEDIVPHQTRKGALARITFHNNHAIWGRIFGDNEIAALVAVDTSVHRPDAWPEDATLLLLIWRDGWKYRQTVGHVSSALSSGGRRPFFQMENWDWDAKRRLSSETYYLVSRSELYPAGDHLSWLCDPKTHMLLPTGWRKDAIPSISGSFITFLHQDKPGYTPTICDISRFTDQPGDLLASFERSNASDHPPRDEFVVRDNESGKMVSWWFWKKKRNDSPHPEEFGISRRGPGDAGSAPQEEGIAMFDWGDGASYRCEADYFLWRLTGLERNALWGIWDQDKKPEMPLPRSVAVTGSPEAIVKFTWPRSDSGEK